MSRQMAKGCKYKPSESAWYFEFCVGNIGQSTNDLKNLLIGTPTPKFDAQTNTPKADDDFVWSGDGLPDTHWQASIDGVFSRWSHYGESCKVLDPAARCKQLAECLASAGTIASALGKDRIDVLVEWRGLQNRQLQHPKDLFVKGRCKQSEAHWSNPVLLSHIRKQIADEVRTMTKPLAKLWGPPFNTNQIEHWIK